MARNGADAKKMPAGAKHSETEDRQRNVFAGGWITFLRDVIKSEEEEESSRDTQYLLAVRDVALVSRRKQN